MIRFHIPSIASHLQLERIYPRCHRPNGRIHSATNRRPIISGDTIPIYLLNMQQ